MQTNSGSPEPCGEPFAGFDTPTAASPAGRDAGREEEPHSGTTSDPPDPARDSVPEAEAALNPTVSAPDRDKNRFM